MRRSGQGACGSERGALSWRRGAKWVGAAGPPPTGRTGRVGPELMYPSASGLARRQGPSAPAHRGNRGRSPLCASGSQGRRRLRELEARWSRTAHLVHADRRGTARGRGGESARRPGQGTLASCAPAVAQAGHPAAAGPPIQEASTERCHARERLRITHFQRRARGGSCGLLQPDRPPSRPLRARAGRAEINKETIVARGSGCEEKACTLAEVGSHRVDI